MQEKLSIEFEDPHYIPCDCCGEDIIRLTRFVYQGDDALAYYYAEIQPHTEEKKIIALVVICEFEGDEISRKIGFPLGLWENEQGFITTLLNANETPWYPIDDMEFLDREQSLQHHYKPDVFRITDEILKSDREVINFFAKKQKKLTACR